MERLPVLSRFPPPDTHRDVLFRKPWCHNHDNEQRLFAGYLGHELRRLLTDADCYFLPRPSEPPEWKAADKGTGLLFCLSIDGNADWLALLHERDGQFRADYRIRYHDKTALAEDPFDHSKDLKFWWTIERGTDKSGQLLAMRAVIAGLERQGCWQGFTTSFVNGSWDDLLLASAMLDRPR